MPIAIQPAVALNHWNQWYQEFSKIIRHQYIAQDFNHHINLQSLMPEPNRF
jgi:hypothetical protein